MWNAEAEDVEALEHAERAFGLQRKVMEGLIKARLYGGAALIMGLKGQRFEDEIDLDRIQEG